MAVIGISCVDEPGLSAKFIKNGANDFLNRPFLTEEFYTRVTQNIELLEYIAQIKELAERDFLTRLHNRRYVFSAGPKLMAAQMRRGQGVVVAMLDIDHFKKINDAYGHDAGDEVLCHLSTLLSSRFRASDIVARFGGEEFCVLAADMNPADAFGIFDDLRQTIADTPVSFGGMRIPYTVSIGLCTSPMDDLEDMIRMADQALYLSKNDGRNCVSLPAM